MMYFHVKSFSCYKACLLYALQWTLFLADILTDVVAIHFSSDLKTISAIGIGRFQYIEPRPQTSQIIIHKNIQISRHSCIIIYDVPLIQNCHSKKMRGGYMILLFSTSGSTGKSLFLKFMYSSNSQKEVHFIGCPS